MPVTFVHEGAAIDYTPVAAVAAGSVVVQGNLVGVTRLDIPAGKLGALAVEGVFDFPKVVGDDLDHEVGEVLYWDETEEVATATATDNKLIGKVVKYAGGGDAKVSIRMSQ